MSLSPIASTEQFLLALRSHLLADDAVANLVGAEVRGAQYQDPDEISVKYPRIALEMDGGYTIGATTYQTVTFFLYAYSRDSRGSAQQIYDAAHAALQQQLVRQDGVNIAGYCLETTRPDYGWSERPRAYYARGLWTLRAAHRGS